MSLVDEVRELGYAVVPRLLSSQDLDEFNREAREQLQARRGPLELEADLRYPGAPRSREGAGGATIRRLLDAFERAPAFARIARSEAVGDSLRDYFGEAVSMSRVHHNCLMTKHPRYGSLTGWHRDIRYWAFEREDLVSVWLALGEECSENGGLWFVPGSHRMTFADDRYDASKFFRADHPQNALLLQTARSPRLEPGDAIFFHCNTLHSAGQNMSETVKYSLVYTYHGRSNAPRPGTRSASMPEVALSRSGNHSR